jgi:hypothetical protein
MNIHPNQAAALCIGIILAYAVPAPAYDSVNGDSIKLLNCLPSLKILKQQNAFEDTKISLPNDQLLDNLNSRQTRLGYYFVQPVDSGSLYPRWMRPSLKLRSWSDDCEHRIAVAREHMSETPIDAATCCTFYVEPNGDIGDLFTWKSSGSTKTDKLALKCIRDAVPFSKPPAEFADKQRILVLFTTKPSVEVLIDIKSYRNSRDRAIFAYIKEHPAVTFQEFLQIR